MGKFIKGDIEKIQDNPFHLIGKEWMLISAGGPEGFNTMTASWGGMGVLWHKPVCTVYIRPNRFTYQFTEKNEHFTLSFFDERYRKALNICGTKSGRDIDKVKETGLTPLFTDNDCVYFEEARMVIECRKLYYQDINPDHFLDSSIGNNYKENDYHRFYIGEVVAVLIKDKE